VNEDIRTWWSAKTANKGEFMTVDLDRNSKVYAIQVNFADQDANHVLISSFTAFSVGYPSNVDDASTFFL